MAEVYWIRFPEHTDLFSEGYVGVTKTNTKARFRGHLQYSKSGRGKTSRIVNIIQKYGREGLVLETLVICDLEYAYELEAKLRPEDRIGWNVSPGGEICRNYGGYTLSEDTKKKMSEARRGVPYPPEFGIKISQALKGRVNGPLSKESLDKREITRFYNNMDKYSDVWSVADKCYQFYLTGLSSHLTEKQMSLRKQSLKNMFYRFADGWVPEKDQRWIDKFKE